MNFFALSTFEKVLRKSCVIKEKLSKYIPTNIGTYIRLKVHATYQDELSIRNIYSEKSTKK